MYTYYKMLFPPLIVIFIVIPMFTIVTGSYFVINYLGRYNMIEPDVNDYH